MKKRLIYSLNNTFVLLSVTLSGTLMAAESMNELSTFGGTFTSANGVSANGSVIVGESFVPGIAFHACN
jgi:uncharacterized membrane protein